MCFVDDQCRSVRVAGGAQRREIGAVGVHAVVALDNDPCPRFGAGAERLFDGPEVEVGDDLDSGAREAGSVDEGRVVQLVADEQIAASRQSRD